MEIDQHPKHVFRLHGTKSSKVYNSETKPYEMLVCTYSDSISKIEEELNESNHTIYYIIKTAEYLGKATNIEYQQ